MKINYVLKCNRDIILTVSTTLTLQIGIYREIMVFECIIFRKMSADKMCFHL